jgi:hypothetical protein
MPGYTSYPHSELPGSPKESMSIEKGGGFSADVELLVPWNYRQFVAAEIVGNCQLYPRAPASGARAVSCAMEPFEPSPQAESALSPGIATYEYSKLSLKYKIQAETSDFISESLEPSSEMVTLNPCNFAQGTELENTINKMASYPVFCQVAGVPTGQRNGDETIYTTDCQTMESGNIPDVVTIDQAGNKDGRGGGTSIDIGRFQRKMEYTITFYRVVSVPQVVCELVDCVNATPMTSRLLGITFPEDTLLFGPPSLKRRWNYTTFPYWEVTYKFVYQKAGWNRWWNPQKTPDAQGGQYDYLYVKKLGAEPTVTPIEGSSDEITWNRTEWKRYYNFPRADLNQAFTGLNLNVAPWQPPNA